eukprot:c16655_g2_i1 orf=275-685(-)
MEQHEEDHRGTVSLAAGDGQQQQEDPLADALHALSLNITTFIQAELQSTTNVLELLEKMNLRIADDYNDFGDFASGLRVFVERLRLKNDGFHKYIKQIDEIDQEVTELEALVSALDKCTGSLEAKIRAAYNEHHIG